MWIPSYYLFKVALLYGGAQLEGRLVPRTDHTQNLRILTRQMRDRDRGGGRRAQRSEVIAAHQRRQLPGIGIEEADRGLVIGQPLLHVARPVAARLEPEGQAGFVKPALEAV